MVHLGRVLIMELFQQLEQMQRQLLQMVLQVSLTFSTLAQVEPKGLKEFFYILTQVE